MPAALKMEEEELEAVQYFGKLWVEEIGESFNKRGEKKLVLEGLKFVCHEEVMGKNWYLIDCECVVNSSTNRVIKTNCD